MIDVYKLKDSYLILDTHEELWINREIAIKGGYQLSWVQFQIHPESIESKTTRRVAVGSTKNGEPIDIELHKQVADEIKIRGGWNDDDEYPKWNSLEDEYAFKKHMEGVECVYEIQTEWKSKEFRIISLDIDGELPPYTTPVRIATQSLDKLKVDLFTYVPNRLELLTRIGSEYGFEFVGAAEPFKNDFAATALQWFLPSHSIKELKFIKIGGSYADYEKLSGVRQCLGTIEECAQRHQLNVALIREFWETEKLKRSSKILDAKTIGHIATELGLVVEMVQKLRVRGGKESVEDQERVIRKIRSIVNGMQTKEVSA